MVFCRSNEEICAVPLNVLVVISNAWGLVLAVAPTVMVTIEVTVLAELGVEPPVDWVVAGPDVELLPDCGAEDDVLCPGLDEPGVFPLDSSRYPVAASAMTTTAHMMNTTRRRAIVLRRRLADRYVDRRSGFTG
jgi:hypothetical protein